jgi:hypothetical protein
MIFSENRDPFFRIIALAHHHQPDRGPQQNNQARGNHREEISLDTVHLVIPVRPALRVKSHDSGLQRIKLCEFGPLRLIRSGALGGIPKFLAANQRRRHGTDSELMLI